jgi:hypothetical protein
MNNVFDLSPPFVDGTFQAGYDPAGQYQAANLVGDVKETFLKAGRISVSGATRVLPGVRRLSQPQIIWDLRLLFPVEPSERLNHL